MNYLDLLDEPPAPATIRPEPDVSGMTYPVVARTIIEAMRGGPLTSLDLFELLADDQDTDAETQYVIDDTLDALHRQGRILLALPEGRWHLRELER